ncbi:Chaperone protein DnaJ [endosymbiont GvMRE of Glomus versiforme]|nr:Chaperone protein DnaJ [endosymbiont GvMRE of Glomus versiforme]
MKDYYEILGIDKNVPGAEIKKTYWKFNKQERERERE